MSLQARSRCHYMTTTAMNGSLRFNLTSELKDSDKPKPFRRVDEYQHGKVYQGILSFDKGIPSYIAKQATDLLAVSNLLDHVDLSKLSILELPATTTRALVVPVPGISRFTMPEPFRGKQTITCALLHGTSLTAAQNILIEGFIRPANWTYHKNPLKCDVPTFGRFTWVVKLAADRDFLNGLNANSWIVPRRKEKDNKRCSSGLI